MLEGSLGWVVRERVQEAEAGRQEAEGRETAVLQLAAAGQQLAAVAARSTRVLPAARYAAAEAPVALRVAVQVVWAPS